MRALYKYQREAARWLYEHPKSGLLAGVGSGKTAVILYVLYRHIMECDIDKVLIVAPVAVVKGVWEEEYGKWSEISGLRFSKVIGTPKQRKKALTVDADIYLINYENLSWLFNDTDAPEFDALVLDESTRVQNATSVLFAGKGKRLNASRRDGLKHRVAKFKFVYIVTGGPKPGEYLGLWSQIYCLDNGKALGKNITEFKSKYYYKYGPEFYHIRIRDDAAKQEIKDRLRPLLYRIPARDIQAQLPRVRELTHLVELPKKTRGLYRELKDDMIAELDSGESITVENIAIVSNKLVQVCQGAIYTDTRVVEYLHDEKLEMLDSLIEDLGSERALIIFNYQHDLERLQKWRKAPLLKSTVKDFNKMQMEWNAGKYPIMYGHPKSMGHGLNLQGGGFHIIWFSLTWSLDLYIQTIGRLRRTGQSAGTVFAHRIVCRDTIETSLMLPRLRQRAESQRDFVKHFERFYATGVK